MVIEKSIFNDRVLSLLVFIINPFLSSIYSFYKIVIRRDFYFNSFLFCLFVGLVGYTFNATPQTEFDLMRVYNNFDIIRNINIYNAIPLFVLNGDLSLATLWIIGVFTSNAQFVGLISIFLLYYSIIIVVDKWYTLIGLRDNYKLYFISIILIFSMIHPLFWSGIRNSIAFSLLIISVILYFENKKIKSNVFLILSVLNHFSILPVAIVLTLSKYFNEKIMMYLSLIMILLVFAYNYIMNSLLNILESSSMIGLILASKIKYYVFGDSNSLDVKLTAGSRIWLVQIIVIIIIFLLSFFSDRVKKSIVNVNCLEKLRLVLIVFSSLLIMNISNVTLVGRYLWFFVVFGVLYLVSLSFFFQSNYVNKYLVFCLYLSIFVFAVAFLNEYHNIDAYRIAFSNTSKLLYCNAFQIFQIIVNYKM